MSRILKRPMFRRGGSTNTGIMSGLVDRKNYKFGSMTEDQIRSNIDMLVGLQDQFAPLPKTRLPIGEVGLALASGADPIQALGIGYKKFVSDDDKTRALREKRKSAAVSTVLGQALKPTKDTRTDIEKKLIAAGYIPGTPEYEAAMSTLLFKDVRQRDGFRLLTGDEVQQLIESGIKLDPSKAYQVNIDRTSKDFNKISLVGGGGTTINLGDAKQIEGQVVSGPQRDKLVKDLSYVKNIKNQANLIVEKIKKDPTLTGGIGEVRRGANKIGTLLKDLGFNVEEFLPKGIGKEFIFDPDIPTIVALENTLAAGYAKVLYPGQKIAVQQINQAKEIINLTGLTGSDEVINRIKQVAREMDIFIRSNESMLGIKEDLSKDQKFRVVDGELVPIKD
tara:strand:+ start:356 stop:1531 length:1176 start_codon:yes stop_codon:yes gene_type:complete